MAITKEQFEKLSRNEQESALMGWHQSFVRTFHEHISAKVAEATQQLKLEDVAVALIRKDSNFAEQLVEDRSSWTDFVVAAVSRDSLKKDIEKLPNKHEYDAVITDLSSEAPEGHFWIAVFTQTAASIVPAKLTA